MLMNTNVEDIVEEIEKNLEDENVDNVDDKDKKRKNPVLLHKIKTNIYFDLQ